MCCRVDTVSMTWKQHYCTLYQCTTEYCFCRISVIIRPNIWQTQFLQNQVVSVFLQKQDYYAEMPIFCRNSLSVTKQGHLRHPFRRCIREKRSVIVHCRNNIILQIIFISADTIYFCRNKLFLSSIRQKQIFCYLVPQILVSVFLLKFSRSLRCIHTISRYRFTAWSFTLQGAMYPLTLQVEVKLGKVSANFCSVLATTG